MPVLPYYKPVSLLFLLFQGPFMIPDVSAQESQEAEEAEESGHGRHRLALIIGHAHIPAGFDAIDDKKTWLNLGAFALDYDYYLSPVWSVGLHSDIVPMKYEVEPGNRDELLIRTNPVTAVLSVNRKVTRHIGLQAGFGAEIAKEESFSLIRVGVEYGWEIDVSWELAASLNYDHKLDAYDTWFLGLGVSRRFGKTE